MLHRGQSFGGSASKRVAKQVMAIGLAPDGDQEAEEDSETQRRLRAESKFTFKPEEGSECYSRGDDNDDNHEAQLEDSLLNEAGEPETAIQFFAIEFREQLEKEFSQLHPQSLRQAIKNHWSELTLKLKSPFE